MSTTSSSTTSSASEEDDHKRKNNKRKRKGKKEELNSDITKGGLDGSQEGIIIHISNSLAFPFYHAYVDSFPVVAYFSGRWSGPAKELNDLVIELSECYVSLTFLKIDLPHENIQRELFDFVEGLKIQTLPAFLFYYEGKQVFKLVGAFSDELIHLTQSLHNRQMLSRVKHLEKEVMKALEDGAPELYVLQHELNKAKEDVGAGIEMYESLGLLDE